MIGEICSAVLDFNGPGTITAAEFRALLHSLELCSALGVNELNIESDSQFVVQAVASKYTASWKYAYILHRCLESWCDSMEIKHVFRQANNLADPSTRLGKNASRRLAFLPPFGRL